MGQFTDGDRERMVRVEEKIDGLLGLHPRVESLERTRTQAYTIGSFLAFIGMIVTGFLGWFK